MKVRFWKNTHTATSSGFRMLVILSLLLGMFAPLAPTAPAYAAQVTKVSLTGRTGTYTAPNGTLYAKSGGALTLEVTTDADTKCVELTGSHTETQTSDTNKTSWSFPLTATGTGGTQTLSVTATAYRQFNPHNKCVANQNETLGTQAVSYVLDNEGPRVTAAVSPAPNTAQWNKADVTITWSATDTGSGVKSGPTPATDSVTADTSGVTKTASATDNLGNSGIGSVTVKLDKTLPTISGSRSPGANSFGWNNTDVTVSFTCDDPKAANDSVGSGIKSCVAAGTDPASASKTLSGNGANQSVSGTTVDNADNNASATVTNISIDKVSPSISASAALPGGAQYTAGTWTNQDVTVSFGCSDALSTIDTCSAAKTLGEGENQSASGSATDKAGNSAGATFADIDIDKTAPNTTATAPTNWNNVDVTVSLGGTDALSGVKSTHYSLNGGAEKTGTSVSIDAEGVHTLSFYSVDNAGNKEAAKTVEVKIDKTKPQINHTQDPVANENGWNNTNVTLTFECTDGGSGIASCTEPQTVTTEGENQVVTGTAVDNAGNSATDPATVSIDKTKPTITPSRDRAANGNDWYKDDVTVSFACSDALSGIKSCVAAGTDPASASKTLGEGKAQSASGTATDAAGNSASATESGINVDKTTPALSGTPSATGWSRDDVTVTWSASDGLSGLAGAAPAPSTVTGEGDNLSASASVSDKAGNTTNATVSGIKIDRTAPSTSASVPDPLESGWYAGAVEVTLTGVDSLSGVDKTYYSVDGGDAKLYNGSFSHSLDGVHTITFWSEDKAGNVEDKNAAGHSIEVKIDSVDPSITGSRSPEANTFGWNNSDVVVSFACSDAHSGLKSCTAAQTLGQGANQSVTGTTVDNVGNEASTTVDKINVDKTAPTLSGAPTNANLGNNGWYTGDVTVRWTGSDALSGIDPTTQPADSVITGEGNNLGAGPVSVSDKAGNTSAEASVMGIKIDRTKPSTTSDAPSGWQSAAVKVTLTAQDQTGLSGVDATYYVLNGGTQQTYDAATGITVSNHGVNTLRFWSVDEAGNVEVAKSVEVKIDLNMPVISDNGATVAADGANGWYKSAVTNKFSAEDKDSGLADTNQASFTKSSGTTEGSVVKINSGSVSDKLGNENPGINSAAFQIDLSDPTASIASPASGSITSNSSVLVSVSAADVVSGVASVAINGVAATHNSTNNRYEASVSLACGANSIKAQATDKAGRQSSVAEISVTRTCAKFFGFYSPVAMGKDSSGKDIYNTAKLGSTVPMKFNVRDASGAEITDSSVIKPLVQKMSSCDSTATLDPVEELTSNPAGLHWDSTNKQWVFNWGTKNYTAGACYRVMITRDGTAATVYTPDNATTGSIAYFKLNK